MGDCSPDKDCCWRQTCAEPVRKPSSLDSEDGFHTGYRNLRCQQPSLLRLQSTSWWFSIKVNTLTFAKPWFANFRHSSRLCQSQEYLYQTERDFISHSSCFSLECIKKPTNIPIYLKIKVFVSRENASLRLGEKCETRTFYISDEVTRVTSLIKAKGTNASKISFNCYLFTVAI